MKTTMALALIGALAGCTEASPLPHCPEVMTASSATPSAPPATVTPKTPTTPTPTTTAIPYDFPKAEDFALPAVTSGSTSAQPMAVIFAVAMTKEGKISVDGKPIANDDDLARAVKAAVQKDPDLRAVILADRQVLHGSVIHVLDLLRSSGVSKIGFGVTRVP